MEIERKLDHIQLASQSQIHKSEIDSRFYYEPLFHGNLSTNTSSLKTFLHKNLKHPFWISSMTGGADKGKVINQNLAKLCHKFGLGMGLGSCRSLLYKKDRFDDFDLRNIIGEDLPFYANIGIAQVEELIISKELNKLKILVNELNSDGLIIHINPLQEYLQPEGDRYKISPLEAIRILKNEFQFPLIVKEVGQGMGPKSLKALIDLEVDAIELAGFGGTNFSKLEILRNRYSQDSSALSLMNLGHTADEMISFLNNFHHSNSQTQIIISGGISDMGQCHYLLSKSKYNSVIGMAQKLLSRALNYEELEKYFVEELEVYYLLKNLTNVVKDK